MRLPPIVLLTPLPPHCLPARSESPLRPELPVLHPLPQLLFYLLSEAKDAIMCRGVAEGLSEIGVGRGDRHGQ